MNLIEYNIYVRDGRNASTKAKADVSEILQKCGFCKLYKPSNNRIIRVLQQFFSIISVPRNSVLFIQYHSNIAFFYNMLSHISSIKKIALIHDLESLRGKISLREEVKRLNFFDVVISHNSSMSKYLKDNGVIKPIFNLHIFDYLLDDNIVVSNNYDINTVFFAGNLAKSEFLSKLCFIDGAFFNLYGARYDGIEDVRSQPNVTYKGSFKPDQLVSYLEGGWGLVWDGNSLDTCSGITGKYLKYNNPHKVSLCIVSERPIIIWEQSAMAEYIKSKGLGIVISSLNEIPNAIKNVSEKDYQIFVNNVRNEKKRLIKGQNLKDVLKSLSLYSIIDLFVQGNNNVS